MIKTAPIFLALLYGLVVYHFSVWRTSRRLDKSSRPLTDPMIKAMMRRMAQALDVSEIKTYIYENPMINGLAAPDGRIFITRGFYRAFQEGKVSADEIASVIAHELGHIALGHSRRRMIDFSGQTALNTGLVMALGRFMPVFIGAWLVAALTRFVAAHLSRSDEYEADAYAAALLVRTGIGIGPQISLFEKLDALTGADAQNAPAWLMSHPHTHERIKALQKLDLAWNPHNTA